MSYRDPEQVRGQPRLIASLDELQERIDAYFARQDAAGKPYTVTGLALALGLASRQALLNYQSRDSAYNDAIKSAKLRIEGAIEERLISGQNNVAGLIFHLKNNAGWTDRQEIDQKSDTKLSISWGAAPPAKPDAGD